MLYHSLAHCCGVRPCRPCIIVAAEFPWLRYQCPLELGSETEQAVMHGLSPLLVAVAFVRCHSTGEPPIRQVAFSLHEAGVSLTCCWEGMVLPTFLCVASCTRQSYSLHSQFLRGIEPSPCTLYAAGRPPNTGCLCAYEDGRRVLARLLCLSFLY